MAIQANYGAYSSYVPTVSKLTDFEKHLPALFYNCDADQMLVIKILNRAVFFVGDFNANNFPEPDRDAVLNLIKTYFGESRVLDLLDHDEEYCFLLNRKDMRLVYDFMEQYILDWENVTFYPSKDLAKVLVFVEIPNGAHNIGVMYTSGGKDSALYVRSHTESLIKPTTMYYTFGKDTVFEIYQGYYFLRKAEYQAREWSVAPEAQPKVFEASQLLGLVAEMNSYKKKLDADEAKKLAEERKNMVKLSEIHKLKAIPYFDEFKWVFIDISFNTTDEGQVVRASIFRGNMTVHLKSYVGFSLTKYAETIGIDYKRITSVISSYS